MAESALQETENDIAPDAARALENATVGDPFSILGPHRQGNVVQLCTYQPNARKVEAVAARTGEVLTTLEPSQLSRNVFVGTLPDPVSPEPVDYRLRIDWGETVQETEDPYAFGPLLGEMDLHLIGEGKHYQLNRVLGAHVTTINGINGVRFAVWAPNARRVSVLGDFNLWDGRRHPMRKRGSSGVWELFIPRIGAGGHYKYEILSQYGVLPLKADPMGWQMESAPGDASI